MKPFSNKFSGSYWCGLIYLLRYLLFFRRGAVIIAYLVTTILYSKGYASDDPNPFPLPLSESCSLNPTIFPDFGAFSYYQKNVFDLRGRTLPTERLALQEESGAVNIDIDLIHHNEARNIRSIFFYYGENELKELILAEASDFDFDSFVGLGGEFTIDVTDPASICRDYAPYAKGFRPGDGINSPIPQITLSSGTKAVRCDYMVNCENCVRTDSINKARYIGFISSTSSKIIVKRSSEFEDELLGNRNATQPNLRLLPGILGVRETLNESDFKSEDFNSSHNIPIHLIGDTPLRLEVKSIAESITNVRFSNNSEGGYYPCRGPQVVNGNVLELTHDLNHCTYLYNAEPVRGSSATYARLFFDTYLSAENSSIRSISSFELFWGVTHKESRRSHLVSSVGSFPVSRLIETEIPYPSASEIPEPQNEYTHLSLFVRSGSSEWYSLPNISAGLQTYQCESQEAQCMATSNRTIILYDNDQQDPPYFEIDPVTGQRGTQIIPFKRLEVLY